MDIDAVIVAAGRSQRFGGDKLLVELCGAPLLAWSLRAFAAAPGVGRVVVVSAPERLAEVAALAEAELGSRFGGVVAGGERRRDSVEAGLRCCRARLVAIHDGARPLVTPALIARCLAEAPKHPGGVIPAVPVTDTVKVVEGGIVRAHPDRARLFAAQTPQVVPRSAWLTAAAASDGDETDDAAMLARLGLEVGVVEGDPENLKVTRALDLVLARTILEGRLS